MGRPMLPLTSGGNSMLPRSRQATANLAPAFFTARSGRPTDAAASAKLCVK